MKQEIRARIDQIRQGIVPKGYKKTKTDIVPADWKESPIGKYIREYNEKTTIPNQYPVLTSARTGLMLQTDYYSNRQVTTEDNVGYNILPYGYITFRSRSDDGRFRFNENRIIERGIISYFYPVFSFSEEVCHEYVLYLLNFSIYRRMYPYAEGTAQQVLSLKKLGQLKYSLPLVAEQKKIAEILSTQDKAIELQGRKIEELERFKKSCLEKMFPRKGQKVPEKRFPGFTDDWEQRKLSEVFSSYTDPVDIPHDGYERLGIRSHAKGTFHSYVPAGHELQTAQMHRVAANKFIVNITFGWEHAVAVTDENDAGKLVSHRFPQFSLSDELDPQFLKFIILDERFRHHLWLASPGGAGRNRVLNLNQMLQYEIQIPCVAEQRKIAGTLINIDTLITLHQRKLEEMKKQKKALMQLLLTGIVRVRL